MTRRCSRSRRLRVINLYDLMGSANDAPEIKAKGHALGYVPIIDPHPRNASVGKEAIAAEARGRCKAGNVLAPPSGSMAGSIGYATLCANCYWLC
jgi:hypothetical protein